MLPVGTTEQCYQWVPVYAGSGNVSDTRMISIDDPTRISYRMQKVGDDVVCQYNRRFWPRGFGFQYSSFRIILLYHAVVSISVYRSISQFAIN